MKKQVREIFIPQIGSSTIVPINATEQEIIDAVSELTILFCISCTKFGNGIEKELEELENDKDYKIQSMLMSEKEINEHIEFLNLKK
jgi:hypothetical protein